MFTSLLTYLPLTYFAPLRFGFLSVPALINLCSGSCIVPLLLKQHFNDWLFYMKHSPLNRILNQIGFSASARREAQHGLALRTFNLIKKRFLNLFFPPPLFLPFFYYLNPIFLHSPISLTFFSAAFLRTLFISSFFFLPN